MGRADGEVRMQAQQLPRLGSLRQETLHRFRLRLRHKLFRQRLAGRKVRLLQKQGANFGEFE